MKFRTTVLSLLIALLLPGCTPPYLGVSLRFERNDLAIALSDVRAVAAKFGFAPDAAAKPGDWDVVLQLHGKQIVRREPLTLRVVKTRDGFSVGVGRLGGLGFSLRPEEVKLIRDLCSGLQALRGYSGVERENGMALAVDEAG